MTFLVLSTGCNHDIDINIYSFHGTLFIEMLQLTGMANRTYLILYLGTESIFLSIMSSSKIVIFGMF